MKYYTSLDQSKRLIDLGIDTSAADMYFGPDNLIIPAPPRGSDVTPAWSLASLIGFLPKLKGEYPKYRRDPDGKYVSYSDTLRVMTSSHEELIDAIVEMMEWCLKHDY